MTKLPKTAEGMAAYQSTEVATKFEIPQTHELFSELFAPLGLFVFCFVRLEREISWSYVSASDTNSHTDTRTLLQKAAEFEGLHKRARDRISKWFNALNDWIEKPEDRNRLNEIKKAFQELNEHRNRLVHDPSNGTHQKFDGTFLPSVSFRFVRQNKDGSTMQKLYSRQDLMVFVHEIQILQTNVRQVTYDLIPTAPRSLI